MNVFELIKEKLEEKTIQKRKLLELQDRDSMRYTYELRFLKEIKDIVDEVEQEYNKRYEPARDLLEFGIDGYNLHLKERYRKGYEDASNDRWIPCSGCKDCQHKECEHYGKV